MSTRWFNIIFIAGVSLHSADAVAGQYAEELSKCLVNSATDTDKKALMQWLYSSIALSEDLRGVITVSPDQHEKATQRAAEIFERLWTKDCATQFVNAVNAEGQEAAGPSITALAQAASSKLMSDPVMAESMKDVVRRIDFKKLPPAKESTKP